MKRSEVEHYVLVQTSGFSFFMHHAHYSVLQQSKTIITFVIFWPLSKANLLRKFH